MDGIQMKNNHILYYGNIAGYLDAERNTAVVDPMFRTDEMESYLSEQKGLSVKWTPGTYDSLASGTIDTEGNPQVLKKCRIHQLKPNADVMMKFIGYDELTERFGEPDPENYEVVYDGEVGTNDLEALYEKFNIDHPPGYKGHSLSISDVVELYDASGSSFHYVDRFGFKEIAFQAPEQEQRQGPQMSL